MRSFRCLLVAAAIVCCFLPTFSQQNPVPTAPGPESKASVRLKAALEAAEASGEVSRENREAAYRKLLEGQRYVWQITNSKRDRSPERLASLAVSAQLAFSAAAALNPRLAEAYTALADVSLSVPPIDIAEAMALASLATRADRDNFGGHRILARLMTFQSGLGKDAPAAEIAAKAIAEWNEVARLDPRNAEAWAFLAAFYEKLGRSDDEVVALRRWISSAPPLDSQFYQRTFGGSESLSPETASIRLGRALLKAGKLLEGIEVLSLLVSDAPDNEQAVESLNQALEVADPASAAIAAPALQQALYANPGNLQLILALSNVYVSQEKNADAVRVLRQAAAALESTDREKAASLYVSLGDLFARGENVNEATTAYNRALSVRGLDNGEAPAEDEREWAAMILEKTIQTFKSANRIAEAAAVIERSRKMFGPDDLFADRQLITLYRESGRKPLALEVLRTARVRFPSDYGLIRLEATVLTEMGKVDEAVAGLRKMMTPSPGIAKSSEGLDDTPRAGITAMPLGYDAFSHYLFISNLYSQANRGKDAAAAADEAFKAAKGPERKQLARLTLATAQQMSGDYAAAETTLRAILKMSPGNPMALNNLGYFLLERDDRLVEALDLIQRAYRVDPTNPSYLDSLGWAYFRMGRLGEAEKYLKEASRLNSGSSTIMEHLGDLYAKQGKAASARTSWERAMQLTSDPVDSIRLKEKLRR